MPFSMTAEPSVLPDGSCDCIPATVKALGIPTKRLMEMFGVELDNLIKLRRRRTARASTATISC